MRLFSACETALTKYTVTVLREGADEPIIELGSFGGAEPGGTDTEPPDERGEDPVPPQFGQSTPNTFTFTFEYPPAGQPDGEQCEPGFTLDPETNECVAPSVCGTGRDLEGIGTPCETPGQLCEDTRFICGSAGICTVTCDRACEAQHCSEDLPSCLEDEAVGEPVCQGGSIAQPAAGEYEPCGTEGLPSTCESPARCLGLGGLEATASPFCSPPCADNVCPAFEGTPAVCGLGEDGSQTPTRCVVVCSPAEPDCPAGMRCQEVSGGGICIWPLGGP